MADTIENQFQQQDLNADKYRWRDEKKRIKFIYFSTFKPSTDIEPSKYIKWQEEDEKRDKRDIDLLFLQNKFVDAYKDAEKRIEQNIRTTELWDILKEMESDTNLSDFDCYFFVFLTFLSTGMINTDAGELHFRDGQVTLDEIWDKVSEIRAMTNKPKIFLVQADDIKMFQKPLMISKGSPFKTKTVKIPTDSDRLTILSTLPSRVFGEKNRPSFLIQAFVDVLKENKNSDDPLDFLSLTVNINSRVRDMIRNCNDLTDKEKDNLPLPCTTSTLKQLLYL